MTTTRRLLILRTIFWAAAALAFVMAILPHPPELPGAPSDKVQHIAAFLALGLLSALAYWRTSLLRIAAGLSLFGAVIELVQAIPGLHRDSDAADWLADTAAVALALMLVRLLRVRRSARVAEQD